MTRGNKKSALEKQKKASENEISSNIIVDFSLPTCWYTINTQGFTNYLKNKESYFEYHRMIFFDLLPRIAKCNFSNLYSILGRHCHIIKEEEKLLQIKKVFIDMYSELFDINKQKAEDFFNQNFNEQKFYQLGDKGALRLIGIKDGYHHFKVLFIDYYHLLFPSEKYNQADMENYSMSLHKRS